MIRRSGLRFADQIMRKTKMLGMRKPSNQNASRSKSAMGSIPAAHASRSDSGFALLLVIWGIGLLSLLFASFFVAARYRSIEAGSFASRAEADSVAEIGIQTAIFELVSGLANGKPKDMRFPPDGEVVSCTLGARERVAISVTNEAGKIDLNTAAPELIRVLMGILHRNERAAEQLANRILSLRELTQASAPGPLRLAESEEGGAIRTILELDQALGSDINNWRFLLPYVTVHSRNSGIDAGVASRELLALLGGDGRGFSGLAIPQSLSMPSSGGVFLVAAEAVTSSGVRSGREAVVEISKEIPNGYRIREWRSGQHQLIGSAMSANRLPRC